jgi:hypothetical protein
MSKPKRKQASPQLLKQQEAENKKRFYRKVKEFLTQFGQPKLFELLTLQSLDKLYRFRISPPIFEFDPTVDVSSSELKKLKDELYKNMNCFQVIIDNKKMSFSAYEYLTTGLTLYTAILDEDCKLVTDLKKIREKIDPVFFELFSSKTLTHNIGILELSLSEGLNNLDGFMYPMKYDLKLTNDKRIGLFFYYSEIKNQKIEIGINGNYRPAYRVGWTCWGEFIKLTMPAKKLRLDISIYPAEIEVYIQSHALHRLSERLDNIRIEELQMCVFFSVIRCRIIKRHGNKYFIEYYLSDTYKVGYLVAKMVDNKLIIQTFLLLTQSETPEEKKLRALTGFEREDIEFLKLDKISAFYDSSLYNDTLLVALFEEAGFKPILDFVRENELAIDRKYSLVERLMKHLSITEEMPNWEEVAETIKEEELA